MKQVECKHCHSLTHYSYACYTQRTQRKPIKTKAPVKRIGKVTKQWMLTRKTWFKRHPAKFYYCYLCGRGMTETETTLDHIKSRSRHPELRFDMDNLAPCCLKCNMAKGSKELSQL